jgi:hypothetical protein
LVKLLTTYYSTKVAVDTKLRNMEIVMLTLLTWHRLFYKCTCIWTKHFLSIELILYNLVCVRRHCAFEYTMHQKNSVMMQAQKAYCIAQKGKVIRKEFL